MFSVNQGPQMRCRTSSSRAPSLERERESDLDQHVQICSLYRRLGLCSLFVYVMVAFATEKEEEPYAQAGSYQSPGNRESIPSLADLDQGIVKLNQFFPI